MRGTLWNWSFGVDDTYQDLEFQEAFGFRTAKSPWANRPDLKFRTQKNIVQSTIATYPPNIQCRKSESCKIRVTRETTIPIEWTGVREVLKRSFGARGMETKACSTKCERLSKTLSKSPLFWKHLKLTAGWRTDKLDFFSSRVEPSIWTKRLFRRN